MEKIFIFYKGFAIFVGNIINGITDKIVPKDGVRRVGNLIEVEMKNPLPKYTLKSFRIEQIQEYSEIFLNDRLMNLEDLQKIKVFIKDQWYSITDFERIEEIKIPHKSHSIIAFPGQYCADSQFKLKIRIKSKKPIEITLEREIQTE